MCADRCFPHRAKCCTRCDEPGPVKVAAPSDLIEKTAMALHAREFGEYRPDAHPDHNFWTWNGGSMTENNRDHWRDTARVVLAAVTPAIQGQALRDAGREWAEGAWQDAYASFPVECDVTSVQATDRWLNERADRIEEEGQ